MHKTSVEFTGGDLAEISSYLVMMAAAENERSGSGGRGLAALYLKLADDLAGQWLALDEDRKPEPVEMPSNALTVDDRGVLEEAMRRLDEMVSHQEGHLPDDEPWRFVIGLLRGHVGAELAVRGAQMN